jgi:hypothetical protein
MRHAIQIRATRRAIMAAVLATLAGHAGADVITDWNQKAGELIIESKLGTPPAVRAMAIVQTAVHGATNAVTRRHAPSGPQPEAAPGASVEAAIAAANRGTLSKLLPSQQAAIDTAYQRALATIAEGPAKTAGIAVGEKAAALALAARADDAALPAEAYRPHTTAGAYVPTATPAVPTWPQRKPWLMANPAQFRPAPPPALGSDVYTRDLNEVKALGSKASARREAGQSEIARFWEFSLPPIYFGVVRSVALTPGRDVTDNARLFATVAQAMDDGLISVFEAKYHYNFWRPATAIRNADIDGNDTTVRDASWTPFVEAPLHPEYPSAHSVLAGVVGTVLREEVGEGTMPVLTTSSPTAKGASRRWTSVDAFVREVGQSRVYAGIHYTFSTDTGLAMGQKIGQLAATRHLAVVPPGLVPAGERPVDRLFARGVQIYACRAKSGAANAAEWVFVAPEAELFDLQGASAGKHYAGPHWEAADGSKIVGAVKARADAPEGGAIPWLLLSARSVGGTGRYAEVTSVQRVNTSGGNAPAQGCSAGMLGTTVRVPYTADYVLFAG